VQTTDGGKHAILPVAGQPDHSGMPAYLPRESDTDMRRDGPGHAPKPPSMSAEDCTAHQNPTPRPQHPSFTAGIAGCRKLAGFGL
jgi:hypothetical protein